MTSWSSGTTSWPTGKSIQSDSGVRHGAASQVFAARERAIAYVEFQRCRLQKPLVRTFGCVLISTYWGAPCPPFQPRRPSPRICRYCRRPGRRSNSVAIVRSALKTRLQPGPAWTPPRSTTRRHGHLPPDGMPSAGHLPGLKPTRGYGRSNPQFQRTAHPPARRWKRFRTAFGLSFLRGQFNNYQRTRLRGDSNMRSNISCRQIFEENVRPVRRLRFRHSGRVRLLLTMGVTSSQRAPGIPAGENGTTDSLMQTDTECSGKHYKEINDYVRAFRMPLSTADRCDAARIEDKVFSAVHDAADFMSISAARIV